MPMKQLITHVTVVDPNSPYNGASVNILIDDDVIVGIGENLTDKDAKVIDLAGAHVSPGWVEMHSNFGDPGFEEREDCISGARAAAAGGFTSVVLTPATQPVIQSKADIEYLLKRGDEAPVHFYPLGAVSTQLEGTALTEMFDMHQAGAVGFYDDKKAIQNPNLLKLALLYAKDFGPIFVHPRHPDLTQGGQMNEGPTSTYLGLKGIPAFAEELMIARDLFIAEYTNGRLHIAGVSSKGSVDLLRQAKAKGLRVTADVNFYNLILTEQALQSYDTNYKVNPPLRNEEDIEALMTGIKDGTIDAIAVDHIPQDIERKRCEFDHAAFGMAAIESAFGCLHSAIQNMGEETFVNAISVNPRAILGLPKIRIVEGSVAELTFYNPTATHTLTNKNKFSRAANNPFINKELTGKVIGIFNKAAYLSAHP